MPVWWCRACVYSVTASGTWDGEGPKYGQKWIPDDKERCPLCGSVLESDWKPRTTRPEPDAP